MECNNEFLTNSIIGLNLCQDFLLRISCIAILTQIMKIGWRVEVVARDVTVPDTYADSYLTDTMAFLALYNDPESYNEQRYRQIDGQTDDRILPIAVRIV